MIDIRTIQPLRDLSRDSSGILIVSGYGRNSGFIGLILPPRGHFPPVGCKIEDVQIEGRGSGGGGGELGEEGLSDLVECVWVLETRRDDQLGRSLSTKLHGSSSGWAGFHAA